MPPLPFKNNAKGRSGGSNIKIEKAKLQMPPIPFVKKQLDEKLVKNNEIPEGYEEGDDWKIPIDNEYISRWSQQQSKSSSRWGPPITDSDSNIIEKSFTAQCFSHFPFHEKSVNEIEILIRKHRIDDLTKRLIL